MSDKKEFEIFRLRDLKLFPKSDVDKYCIAGYMFCHEQKQTKIEKLQADLALAREAINTTWRFIGAYKNENKVPLRQALQSAEYHLEKADLIFNELDKKDNE